MHDLEGLVAVGELGPVEHVEQPRGGREREALVGDDALAALEGEQGGARDGVERLEATVDEGRQAAEGDEVEGVAVGRRAQRGEHEQRGGGEHEAREEAGETRAGGGGRGGSGGGGGGG